jgi:uncharacterized protein
MRMFAGAWSAAVVSAALAAGAQTTTPPPAPKLYFNDYAGLVSAADAQRLNEKLARFDEQSSNQVLVAVYPELPSPSMEDFTIRAAEAWKAGRGKLDNGVVFFVFVKDRKMRMEVGYGLEGALPDATAKRIIEEQVSPAFREGQYARGLEAGVDAIIAVTRGEYQAEAPRRPSTRSGGASLLILLILLVPLFVVSQFLARRGPASFDSTGFDRQAPWGMGSPYRRRRRRRTTYWGGGGGGWGGGGGGGFGGGFSGGGGSFGGGGASGSW